MSKTPNKPLNQNMPQTKMPRSNIEKQGLMTFFKFARYVFQRFHFDRMQQRAASLTFTSLLAIVPLLAISFAIFAAFPAFDSLKDQAQDFIFKNFVPQIGSAVQSHLENFTAKAQGGLSVIGILFLGLTSIMLLVTISSTFNDIWRARQPRAIISRLLVFWAILTLGPLFFGANISISSALFAYAQTSGLEDFTGPLARFLAFLPFVLQSIGFTIMFLLIPNFPVRKRDALIGGLVAGILLEMLKNIFAFYITNFPTYETIYGAMATIPIFLLWVYLSWIVVLFSAEFTAAMPEWRAGSRRITKDSVAPTDKLTAIISVLHALKLATKMGTGLTDRQLPIKTHLGPEMMAYAITNLEDMGFIVKAETGNWHLCKDLKGHTVGALTERLGLTLSPKLGPLYLQAPWGYRLLDLLEKSKQEMLETLNCDLSDILDDLKPHENYPVPHHKVQDETEVCAPENQRFISRVLTLIGLGAAGS